MSKDVFDKEELLEEIDDDWEFLEESVAMLKEDAPALVANIRAGVDNDDADVVWQNAHTVKSMVGNFAAGLSFEAAYGIESRGRANDLADIGADVDNLETEIGRLTSALEGLLASARR